MAPQQDDQLEMLSSLLVSLRNTAATFGEGSAQYRQMKVWVDDHISASATATAAEHKSTQEPTREPTAASNDGATQQAATSHEVPPQQQHVFNLAFRPRPHGAGYAQ